MRDDLASAAEFLDAQLGPEIPADRAAFAGLCRGYQQFTRVRISLLRPDGSVDFDSLGRPEELEKQLGRPEIQKALDGGSHDEIRYNAALISA